jgi:hypothetical protein
MSIPAVKSFTNYNKYKTETGYTKQGELQQYMQNQNDVLTATAQVLLWQPETSYTVGQLVSSPSMSAGTLARVTTAGKTSDTEPTWTASGTTVTDGTVTWTVTKAVLVADLATSDEAKAGTATDKIITASTLKAAMDAAISTAVAAAMKQAKLDAHPVGSYYFSDDSTSPATLFGGTWEALPAGYTLIAQGSGSDDFGSYTYTAGQKYGERMHKLTVDELPHLTGRFPGAISDSFQVDCSGIVAGKDLNMTKSTSASGSVQWGFEINFGSDKAHQNTPLSLAVYGWRRTA